MSKIVTIYGGSGFVGRQIARRMAKDGWRVRVAVRRPSEALFVRTYGAVGQVEPVPCNIRDDVSVLAAMADAEAVVNCVGILVGEGRNRFDAVHHGGAGRIARLAAEQKIARLIHVSALGADGSSESEYLTTKAEGEQAVLEAFPAAVILRPSLIFGPEGGIYERFAKLAGWGPVMAMAGGDTKVQPVYVDDVAAAAEKAVLGEVGPGIYELGGPDVMTMREVVAQTLNAIYRRRAVVDLPFWLAGIAGAVFDFASMLTGGLFTNRVLTRDQVRMLRYDNIVGEGSTGFEAFGIDPLAAEAVIGDYLWRFRRGGQYAAMTASAKNLRAD
ncbi:complex I NDUFA9 subunit family protein [Paracoccus aerodenitrificans]|uniref:complex I NDUFA9 subunit family protein n=1 Tax=Paracoccus aerodenitrificans TaxID=3017781 RepID=UPI0022F07EEB|nr:complex I NDUFA9 subunit family protein [Paracoccus aerodenitrificans]WBU63444.1 complex I NDUFA9 subunit family protein [Paracoccus aerodenitrificans]